MAKMVDLKRDAAEEPKHDPLEYPPGACICLDEEMLDKLDLDKLPAKGDELSFSARARVEEVHDGRFGTHIAMQITHIGLDGDDEGDRKSKRYGKGA